MSLNNRVLRCW